MTTWSCFANIFRLTEQGEPVGEAEFSARGRCYILKVAGSSAAWLARLPWEQEVVGSNPISPI